MRSSFAMLAKITEHSTDGNLFCINNFMSCCGVSAWSINIIAEGANEAICRTNSLPILPAAPVTKMRLPVSMLATSSISIVISLRGKRSLMLTGFKSFTVPSCVHSFVSGSIKIFTPCSINRSCNFVSCRKRSFCIGETNTVLMPSRTITSFRWASTGYTLSPINNRVL